MKQQTSLGWIATALVAVALPAWGQVTPQGPELRVNHRTDFRQQNPAAAFASNGSALVVWENDQKGVRGQFFGADGNPAGGELTLAASDALSGGSEEQQITARREPAVAFLAGGGFVLAWTESREDVKTFAFIETRTILDQDVMLQRFDSLGRPAGQRVLVNTTTAGLQSAPRLIARSHGDMIVTWQGSDGGIFARTVNAAGNLSGHETRLNDAAGSHPVGAASNLGASLIAWEAADGGDVGVFARILDAVGQPVGPAFRVNTTTVGRQRRPAVAAGTDGNFLVAWQGDLADPRFSSIFAQAVGKNGNPLGPQLALVQGVGYDIAQLAPALAATPSGHFLMTWMGWESDTSPGLEMAAAEIDSLGNTIGTPTWINQQRVQRNFRRTAIAANGAGSYLVAWETVANSRQSIDARRIGAN